MRKSLVKNTSSRILVCKTQTQTQRGHPRASTIFILLSKNIASQQLLFVPHCTTFILTRQLHETGGGGGGGGEDDDDDEDEGLDANHAASGAAEAEPSNYIVVANSEFKFKLWHYDASQIQVIHLAAL